MTPVGIDTVAAQLADELGGVAAALTPLIGLDLGLEIEQRITGRARTLAGQLLADDDRIAAETVIDVMCVLWPHGAPEQVGRPEWWQTPLGQACARSLGHDTAEAVSRSVAAAMLGVHPGTIAQMVHRGTLDRHPDGGVLRASVLQRLARRAS